MQNRYANQDYLVVKSARDWTRNGETCYLVTVISTFGSAPRSIGSLMAINPKGETVGSVSGGCIEDDICDQLCSPGITLSFPHRKQYGVSAHDAQRWGLPCGGQIELLIEKITDPSSFSKMVDAIENRQTLTRCVELNSGKIEFSDCIPSDQKLVITEKTLTQCFRPTWRLLIIGANQIAYFLAQFAHTVDFETIVCDARDAQPTNWDPAIALLTRMMPDDAVREFIRDKYSAVVAVTHDPKHDDLALIDALATPASYIGAIGSLRTQQTRHERLLQFGIEESTLRRLRGPVGFKIGSKTPAEIAIAIIAEIIAVKNEIKRVKNNNGTTTPQHETITEN